MPGMDSGISLAEYEWHQLKGFLYWPNDFMGIREGVWCMNCHSQVILLPDSHEPFPRQSCPNDECYNFARGIDFWLTGEEWLMEAK